MELTHKALLTVVVIKGLKTAPDPWVGAETMMMSESGLVVVGPLGWFLLFDLFDFSLSAIWACSWLR